MINQFRSFFKGGWNKRANVVWKGMWVAIVWEIWIHINNVVFNNGIVDYEKNIHFAQIKGWSCAKYRNPGVVFSVSD